MAITLWKWLRLNCSLSVCWSNFAHLLRLLHMFIIMRMHAFDFGDQGSKVNVTMDKYGNLNTRYLVSMIKIKLRICVAPMIKGWTLGLKVMGQMSRSLANVGNAGMIRFVLPGISIYMHRVSAITITCIACICTQVFDWCLWKDETWRANYY